MTDTAIRTALRLTIGFSSLAMVWFYGWAAYSLMLTGMIAAAVVELWVDAP